MGGFHPWRLSGVDVRLLKQNVAQRVEKPVLLLVLPHLLTLLVVNEPSRHRSCLLPLAIVLDYYLHIRRENSFSCRTD